jgi:hypothetical protein
MGNEEKTLKNAHPEFQTHDLYLAAALKIHGFKIIDLKRNGNGRGIFIFKDQPNRTQFVRTYFSGELIGSLKAFSNAWSDLKSLISEMEMEKKNGNQR